MTLFYEWQDFLVFPVDPDKINTFDERVDVASQKTAGYIKSKSAHVITKETCVRDKDVFEAMDIDAYGNVMIWTKLTVWCLRRVHGIEKLMYLPRFPVERNYTSLRRAQ